MRIRQEDLAAFVATALLNIRTGVENARNAGLIAELPEKVQFTVEVIQTPQSLSSITTTAATTGENVNRTAPNSQDVTTESGGAVTTAETGSDTTTDAGTRSGTNVSNTTGTQAVTGNQTQNVSSNEGSIVAKGYQ